METLFYYVMQIIALLICPWKITNFDQNWSTTSILPPESEKLVVDKICKRKLMQLKIIKICHRFRKIGSRGLGGYLPDKVFR